MCLRITKTFWKIITVGSGAYPKLYIAKHNVQLISKASESIKIAVD